ncbi:MAG: hypothetical protein AB9866_28530 [Syntrophobacteraceae bacterium]
MSRSTQWLSLTGGILIFAYGLMKAFDGDWVPFILGLLIVAFTLSKMIKTRAGKEEPSDQDIRKS